MDWSKYENFSKEEFDCKHSGLNRMRPEFMDVLQQIRTTFGKPMVITSGYRDATHPVEAKKDTPGEHYYGMAADVSVRGDDFSELFVIAHHYGIRRLGMKHTFKSQFLHIGMGDQLLDFPRVPWTY